MYTALFTVDELRDRAIMPAADLRRMQGLQWKKATDDASAATATPETNVGVWDRDGTLEQALFVPSKALVADSGNYATLTLYKRTNNAAAVVLAALDTTMIGWTPGAPLPLAIAVSDLAAGDSLTVDIVKTGDGVVVVAGELFLIVSPNFVTTTIDDVTSEMLARLAKRYAPPTAAKPWPSPVTSVLKRWGVKIVARELYHRRGFQPASEQDKLAIEDAADKAEAKLLEAADGKDGLFELSLGDAGEESVDRGAPLFYSEQSPYTASRLQRKAGRLEDETSDE